MGLYARFVLPWLLEFAMSRPQIMRERPQALADAAGEVLEIGFGTGLNLACYPAQVSHLTVVDPAELLPARVARRIAAAPMPVSVARLDAEQLPFDAGRFPCVVSTWTLCTIPHASQALAEIRRVLAPGGRYLFLEHGLSQEPRIARRQNRVDRLHGCFTGGCHVNREIDRLIESAGLAIERLERFDIAGIPRYVASHYRGAATVA